MHIIRIRRFINRYYLLSDVRWTKLIMQIPHLITFKRLIAFHLFPRWWTGHCALPWLFVMEQFSNSNCSTFQFSNAIYNSFRWQLQKIDATNSNWIMLFWAALYFSKIKISYFAYTAISWAVEKARNNSYNQLCQWQKSI